MTNLTLQQQLEELIWLKEAVEHPAFQRYIAEPMFQELDALKPAYGCDSLKELHYLKGKKEGLETFTRILKNLPTELKNVKFELDRSSEGE